jgi:phenylacetate-CoA ligase
VGEYDLTKAFYETLLETERLPKSELQRYQAEPLRRFLEHAGANVPFYRDRRMNGAIDPHSSAWREIPTINRSTLAAYGSEFMAPELPRGHGEFRRWRTGGSTGAQLDIALSQLFSIARLVPTFRMFNDYKLDPSLTLFMIRNKDYSARWTDDLVFRKWAFPWMPEDQLGDRIHLDIEMPITEQLDRLGRRSPAYVHTLPWNILRLGLESRRSGKTPSIPVLISVAEYLAPEVRALAEQMFGSRVVNILSSAEGGIIAIECPAGRLHIQSEVIFTEILNEVGRPCQPGETGELVITPFYNYAMPLIRYRTGDYVVAGGDCSCGRPHPNFERFVGRKEHLFQFLDGSRRLPPIDRVRITELIGHDAWVLVQTEPGVVELRHEQSWEIGTAADAVREHLSSALGNGWSVALAENAKVPKTSGGKRHFCINAVAHPI